MTLIPLIKSEYTLTLFSSGVAAGFPSPADDYIEKGLSLDELLIKHPSATYLARADGNSMTGCGIFNDDILIVDKSITAKHGDIVIAAVDGALTCKFLNLELKQLLSANPKYPPLNIGHDTDLIIEGVVISSIRIQRPCMLW